MKQERKEELIVRWMDDALSAAEVDEMKVILESEPELHELRANHLQTREELQSAFNEIQDVPYGDFFQTKLDQAIRATETPEPEAIRSLGWKNSLRWWLAPVTVGAMAVAFLAGTRVNSGGTNTVRSIVAVSGPIVYTPEGGVTSNFVDAEGSGTSVIVLDGLPPIPDSFNLMAGGKSLKKDNSEMQLITAKTERKIY